MAYQLTDAGLAALENGELDTEPRAKLLMSIIKMMGGKKFGKDNLLDVANKICAHFGGVDAALEAIANGEVELEVYRIN